jgi:4-alpha-glucanotransferase
VSARGPERELSELLRLCGVRRSYRSSLTGRRERAPLASLRAVLAALGQAADTPRDVSRSLAALRHERATLALDPLLVAWGGRPPAATLRIPGARAPARADCRLDLQDGELREWTLSLAGAGAGKGSARSVPLALPGPLPPGIHRLSVGLGAERHEARVLSAPVRAWRPAEARRWGGFLPLYALHGERSWGAGHFGDLAELGARLAECGGDVVATLPLLPTFLDRPLQPSPYLPVSRRYWNEFYLDVERLPELPHCEPARRLLASSAMRHRLAALSRGDRVPWQPAMAARRAVLEPLARAAWPAGRPAPAGLSAWMAACPGAEDYARFRAVCETRGEPFRHWPARLRDGELREGDADGARVRHHLWVQWRTDEQLGAVAAGGSRLLLDLPLGVHPDGYDAWRERARFAVGVSGGAPPDGFFVRGQDWGFPPLHPGAMRASGLAYTAECLAHHMRHADVLRIDHVMGLHRLFWVPHGATPAEGVYVDYPAEPLYALLCLLSHRTRTLVLGEDLGTVPRAVPAAMRRHGIQRTYVLQYELPDDARAPLRRPGPGDVATLNTHDMPTFRGFLEGRDIPDRQALGLLDARGAERERARRARVVRGLRSRLAAEGLLAPEAARDAGAPALLPAALEWLGRSPARIVLVNLEDLAGELRPQNTPGTTDERPNWQLRARHALPGLLTGRDARRTLARLHAARSAGAAPSVATAPRSSGS